MKTVNITKLCEHPDVLEQAAVWFAQKWSIPVEAYRESIQACIERKTGVPQWYVVLDETQAIIAGAGIIENDFHERKDLTPNLCALFVEQAHRRRGIARHILNFARNDMGGMGVHTLYLVTDYMGFYEKYGWDFYAMVDDDEGNSVRMYAASTQLL